jgi:UDP-N-acetylmuramate: L-alanyl-gamma-D-glutamyl-meso-diaminopimelate ligase
MIQIKDGDRIYFLAICGTAMAALAVMLKQKGFYVYGSDQGIYPPMSTFLQEHQVPCFSGYDVKHLDPLPDVVVVGNAISRGNCEIEEILARHIPYVSLPFALRELFIRGRRSIVVAGTHGKTTTTSLLAWIFEKAGRNPGFLIGGIPNNFGRGFQVGGSQEFIVEGDEYDSAFFEKTSKFLHYMPDIGIINHIEFDHADIFNSLDEIKTAFKRFVNLIPGNGLLVACADFDTVVEVASKALCPVQTFGLKNRADWTAEIKSRNTQNSEIDVYFKGKRKGVLSVPLLGEHNIRNVLAATAVSNYVGIDFETIQSALESFKGVLRRLELVGREKGVAVYDDFGHHPTAIKGTLAAFRYQNPNHKIWALFEPRTATTRRNIFQNELAGAFDCADAVLLAPIDRPEKVPEGQLLNLDKLSDHLTGKGKLAKKFDSIDEMVTFLTPLLKGGDVVIAFSNGPFGHIHHKLLDSLKRR